MKNNWTTAVFQNEVMNEPRMVRLRNQAQPFYVAQPQRLDRTAPQQFGTLPLPLPGSTSPIQQTSHSNFSFD